jgi:hypothetical protein
MKKQIAVLAFVLGLSMSITAVAAQDSGISETTEQNSDVNVTVSNITKLDVRPTQLDYTNLNPGALQNSSNNSFGQVEIENIGSEDIEQIAASTTMPSDSPYGTGDSSQYDSGNFVKLKTETVNDGSYPVNSNIPDETDYHFVNRIEFEEDPAPSYIQTLDDSGIASATGISEGNAATDVGRFRVGQQQYFYVIYYGDDSNGCNGAGNGELWVGTTAHTPDTLGTYDFTDATAGDVVNNSIQTGAGGDYYGEVEDVSLGSQTYDVYTHCRTTHHTQLTKWNVDVSTPISGDSVSGSVDVSGQQSYFLGDLSSASNSLRPGSSFPLDIAVEVPLGVAEGEVSEGELTITASTFSS